MRSKIESTHELINEIERVAKGTELTQTDIEGLILGVLCDIAASLSIIADNMDIITGGSDSE